MQPGSAGQIVEVQVSKASEQMGTKNLVEDIRVKTQDAAYRFSETGPEKVLKVEVTRYQSPNAGMAFFVSTGSSMVAADVTLIDKASGKASEKKSVFAQNFRPGGIIGAIAAASTDPISDERSLTSQLAENILKQVYGDDAAKKAVGREPSQKAVANYPVSYQEERQRFDCAEIRMVNETAKSEAEVQDQEPVLRKVPDYCDKYPPKTS